MPMYKMDVQGWHQNDKRMEKKQVSIPEHTRKQLPQQDIHRRNQFKLVTPQSFQAP